MLISKPGSVNSGQWSTNVSQPRHVNHWNSSLKFIIDGLGRGISLSVATSSRVGTSASQEDPTALPAKQRCKIVEVLLKKCVSHVFPCSATSIIYLFLRVWPKNDTKLHEITLSRELLWSSGCEKFIVFFRCFLLWPGAWHQIPSWPISCWTAPVKRADRWCDKCRSCRSRWTQGAYGSLVGEWLC